MSNMRLVRDYYRNATLADSPSMVSTLPVTNSQNVQRDAVARSTSSADQVITGHWDGNTRQVDSFMIFRHTGYGGQVRLQLWANADYTSSVYDSGTVDFVSALPTLENFEWGVAPGLGLSTTDPLIGEAPHYLFFTAATCASFTLTFTRCQHLYWQFTRILLGKYLELPYNPKVGRQFGFDNNGERRRTRGGSLRTREGERFRGLTVDLVFENDANQTAARDFLAQVVNEDVGVSLCPGAGGRAERDGVANMQIDSSQRFSRQDFGHEIPLSFLEV